MYKLSASEVRAFKSYATLKKKTTTENSGAYLVECQSLVENIAIEACLKKCKVSVSKISDALSKLDDEKDFIERESKEGSKTYKTYKEGYKKFRENVLFIKTKADGFKHQPNITPTEQEADLAKKYIENCLEWYAKTIINSTSVESTDITAKNIVIDFLPNSQKEEGQFVERDKQYLNLLIDSSQSMLHPFLTDRSNWDKPETSDYKRAVSKTQSLIADAHEKMLNAFRGSFHCRQGCLWICQYTFNSEENLINSPEKLSSGSGYDKVMKINSENYYPDGMTALYEVVDKSLKYLYSDLMKTMEQKRRIDKISIGIITDGQDTIIEGVKWNDVETYKKKKEEKLRSINNTMLLLRGNGDLKKAFLRTSVLIGLTSREFKLEDLKEIKKELNFDDCFSIDKGDDISIRHAFQIPSTII